MYVLHFPIMSYILSMLICLGMILLDNMLEYFLFIVVIYLSSTFDCTTISICNSLFMFMIYFWIKIKQKVFIFPTIQKAYCSHFSFMAEFVDALRLGPFIGMHFKRWQARVTLWLIAMGVFWVSNGKPEGQRIAEHEKAYEEANTLFVSAVIGALVDFLQDVYLHNKTGKNLLDVLNNDYGGLDVDIELYIIGQYHHDYKMVDGKRRGRAGS
jgi:hypothetical protein